MKRRLCAVLLAGMLLLGSTAAAASTSSTFKDQSKINQTEAVNIVNLLGIMSGYDNGKFEPTKTVTRAEMAKILYVLATGSDDASKYDAVSVPFWDIDYSWAKNYIQYCYSAELLSGKGNGKFAPDDSVTAVETAKMLLVLSGYDSTHAGFSGSDWQSNVLRYASNAGLLENVTMSLTEPLTREFAAQLLANALELDYVKWSNNSAKFNATDETMGKRTMRLVTYDGVLLSSIGASIDGTTVGLVQARILEDGKTSVTTIDNMTRNYAHLLGKHVKAYSRTSGINYGMIADDYNTVDIETKGSKVTAIDGENRITVDKKEYAVNTAKGVTVCILDAVEDANTADVYTIAGTTQTIDSSPLQLAEAISAGGSGTVHVISNDGDYTVDVIVFYTKNFVKQYFVE